MKKRDLEQRIKAAGWWNIGGTKHDKWTNGNLVQMVPRHNEINEWTARGILRVVEANPVRKGK